jgi:hypothetical protein
MTTTSKVLIIAGTCVLLGGFALVAAGMYWWVHHGRELVQSGADSIQEGDRLGGSTDNQGCMNEALSRYKQHQGIGGSISTSLFLKSCLDSSRPTAGFCDDVPTPTEFIKAAEWETRKCEEAGLRDPGCPQLYAQVQQYCQRARLKRN